MAWELPAVDSQQASDVERLDSTEAGLDIFTVWPAITQALSFGIAVSQMELYFYFYSCFCVNAAYGKDFHFMFILTIGSKFCLIPVHNT